MYARIQILESDFQVLLIFLPRHSIDPWCRIPLEPGKRCAQQINVHMVKQSGELLLLV